MPELRKDPITRRWVIIATERAARPTDFPAGEAAPNHSASCPFCEGREERTPPEIAAVRRPGTAPNSPGWEVRVVPNKYPALGIEGSAQGRSDGLFETIGGFGAHEVIIETPHHGLQPATMTPGQFAPALWMYRERYRDLDRDERFKYLLLFRNHGRPAGASLSHPHSQCIALPIVPKRATEELEGAQAYFAREGRCVYCDILNQESAARLRVVWENDEFAAFTPFAAWSPFECWVVPKRHEASFGNLGDPQIPALADAMHQTLGRLYRCLNDPPYNYIIHTAPYDARVGHFYHWHIEILPRLSQVAGFEWGSGFYINTVPPEDAARYLREVGVPAPAASPAPTRLPRPGA
ncbi:MAG: galactose-1-phosphate uridylyltransferase [Bacillati bacterium ANGP1]|uniref:Galactose-1-phosphate uridylyltransferase n=1 Tax=Candidatus Segetimicrobium genomatis TaxID=2569760 RepID=A0A537J6I6_9BACT|nr:MAG: galactose-1-phosphate uridylyltransferase [Terrabacteria group bacterium ANGP1]